MSNPQAWFNSNQKIAYLIPLLVVGLSLSQLSLHGTAALVGQGVCTLGLLGCVAAITRNVLASRKS
ncbi:hypothetical protein ABZ858_31315 [Streptomyces sp. NPDC047017]|uniref:hypothetical protein n=1 Tax=Streptomyces sp. NPDC047017 TaxID=3155024 RepID=UPI003403D369